MLPFAHRFCFSHWFQGVIQLVASVCVLSYGTRGTLKSTGIVSLMVLSSRFTAQVLGTIILTAKEVFKAWKNARSVILQLISWHSNIKVFYACDGVYSGKQNTMAQCHILFQRLTTIPLIAILFNSYLVV